MAKLLRTYSRARAELPLRLRRGPKPIDTFADTRMLLGRVASVKESGLGFLRQRTARVLVSRQEFDANFNTFFEAEHLFTALIDDETLRKNNPPPAVDDYVMIRALPRADRPALDERVTHRLHRVVERVGVLVDPFTNKRLVSEGVKLETQEKQREIYRSLLADKGLPQKKSEAVVEDARRTKTEQPNKHIDEES